MHVTKDLQSDTMVRNRNIFRSLLNTANEILGSRRLAGRLFHFHVIGPETLKSRSPITALILGTASLFSSSGFAVWYGLRQDRLVSTRYREAKLKHCCDLHASRLSWKVTDFTRGKMPTIVAFTCFFLSPFIS